MMSSMAMWMLESAFRSLMMAAVVWAGIRLLRVRGVGVQKTAWTLVLAASLAMPWMLQWHLPQRRAAVVVPVERIAEPVKHLAARVETVHFVETPSTTLSAAPVVQDVPSAPTVSRVRVISLKAVLADLYCGIAAALLLRLLLGVAMAWRLWYRAEEASALLDPRAAVGISEEIETPVTVGSTILLPATYEGWDAGTLRVVLAHERSHVQQGDFYLQLLAGVYAAFFWFNPLSWWLKKEISDLGEAVADRAALKESESRASYAELLVEFASMRRKPLAGVAMARSSNLHRRVERLLTETEFRNAFSLRWWQRVIVAGLVPAGLVAALSLVRVEAAVSRPFAKSAKDWGTLALSSAANTVTLPKVHAVKPVAAFIVQEKSTAAPAGEAKDSNSFVIMNGDSDHISSHTGPSDDTYEKDRGKLHGKYIWFEHNGKSYVIDDPALIEQAQAFYKSMQELSKRQGELGEQQSELGVEQGKLGQQQAVIALSSPDVQKAMRDAQAAVANVKLENLKVKINQEEIQKQIQEAQNALQLDLKNQNVDVNIHREEIEKAMQSAHAAIVKLDLEKIEMPKMDEKAMAEMQANIAEMRQRMQEARTSMRIDQAQLSERMTKLAEQQAVLGREQGDLGARQSELSKEATQKMKSLIDGALQSGKARPVQ